jgi:hypothetical protein
MRSRLLLCSLAATFLLLLGGQASAAIYWSNGGLPIGRVNLNGAFPEPNFVPAPPPSPTPPSSGGNEGEFMIACGGVAVSASHVFWADPGRDAIGRANLDGSNPNYLFITGANNPCGIAASDTHVFWANAGGNEAGTTIGRATLDGSAVDHGFIEGLARLCGVAVNRTHLYWHSPFDGSIGRADLSGQDVERSFIEKAQGGCGIEVDESHIYWADLETAIGRATLAGADVNASFIDGLDRPCDVAVFDDHLYWAEDAIPGPGLIRSGRIGFANVDGSGVNRGLLTELDTPCGIAVDSLAYVPRPPVPIPASRFRLGKMRHSTSRPVAFLAVHMPEPGSIDVSASPGANWSVGPRQSTPTPTLPAGRRWVKVWPANWGRDGHRLRQRIKRHGKAAVAVRIVYSALGKSGSVKHKRVVLFRAGKPE